MSRFRALVRALEAPLAFAREHPDRALRAPEAARAVRAALASAAELHVPPDALRRMREARELVAGERLDAETAERVTKRLGPLLDPDYPRRALGLPPDRLPGVGPKTTQALSRKEINTIEDLLFFLPRAYEDRRALVPIGELQVGQPACFVGVVARCGIARQKSGRRTLQVVVNDGTGAVALKWFRGLAHFEDRLKPGMRLLVAGEVRRYRYAKELHHPEVEEIAEDPPARALARIVPVYSLVQGIAPRTLRRVVESAVRHAADLVEGHLPEALVQAQGLPELGRSLAQVHLPGPHLDPDELARRTTPYHMRLVSEELFLLQAGLGLRKRARARRSGRPLAPDAPEVAAALRALPFTLTGDQRRAWDEIAADLRRPRPMNRLLVGDVGTGKTAVALLAAVAARAAGRLTAVLAPTEILAEQHERTLAALGEPIGLRVGRLTGSTPAAERRALARALRAKEIGLVVGTHALLTDSVALPELGLVVIDEQHRFGVAQRQVLPAKGDAPHVLGMSATPIPRTLSLTLFGDLDASELRERPPGRAPVETRVVPPDAGRQVLDELHATLARGEQVYVVYPLVEESEASDLKDAVQGFERLRASLRGVSVGLVHGRLDAKERSERMRAFAAGELAVLVATTVIEVGVDVPRATLLIVQHAERFGLAQLHQLRGRVGRGVRPGKAILFGDPKSEDAGRRLAVLEASDSGFEIAEADLRIRGAGEWLGKRQAGHLPELRLADLVRHGDLLPELREAALGLVEVDPELARHPALRAAIERRWGRRLDLGSVA